MSNFKESVVNIFFCVCFYDTDLLSAVFQLDLFLLVMLGVE